MSAKILILDDEPSIRESLDLILTGERYEVSTAESFQQAIKLVDTAIFDVIVTDIILGGKTGLDFVREIKAREIAASIIVITGYPNIENVTESLRCGAFDYLVKPVKKDDLIHSIETALRHSAVLNQRDRFRDNVAAIFRSVKDAIISVDAAEIIVEVNDQTERICGYKREEAVGKPLYEICSKCSGRCFETVRQTMELRRSLEISRFECRNWKNTELVLTLNTYPLLDRLGGCNGCVIVLRDETRLVSLEKKAVVRFENFGLIGESLKMHAVYGMIEHLADVDSTVLITGESGTGKELVAEALHNRGARAEKPFIKVNCAALPEQLLEAELFGHLRGAFTGAVRDRDGRFKLADGGSVLLDEISEVSPAVQVKLLRFLQDKTFERLGDARPVSVDVRIIAATNADLQRAVKDGRFRQDLYYRLKVVELNIPPLRDKKEDIPLLIEHFIKTFNKKLSRDVIAVSDDVLGVFMNYDWPGNIRELRHAIESAFIMSRKPVITVSALPKDFLCGTTVPSPENEDIKYDKILQALQQTRWNKSKAAKLLGIDRRTIYRKLEKHEDSAD
jgi:PAS domain S-box-containing protein